MYINRDGGKFMNGPNASFNLYMNGSHVEISAKGQTYYKRDIVNSLTWYDESHQRIVNATMELEKALRAVVPDHLPD